MLTGSKVAASSSTWRVDPLTSLLAPPMTPARATAPRSSAMTMSPGSSARSTPSSVVSRSPGLRPADGDAPVDLVEVEGVQRVPQLEQDVVGDVDQVGDRPDPAGGQPQPHRRAGWAPPTGPMTKRAW